MVSPSGKKTEVDVEGNYPDLIKKEVDMESLLGVFLLLSLTGLMIVYADRVKTERDELKKENNDLRKRLGR